MSSNNNCILCQFPNEGNCIAIGYASWVIGAKNKTIDFDKIIKEKTIVEIKWPEDKEVHPPPMNMDKVKKWCSAAAIILAKGGIVLLIYF